MAWRVADSILTLRGELDARWPNRNRVSDGTIGDAAHAARTSDHNPFIIDHNGVGVVRAFDITHDPTHGPDGDWLADHLRGLGERSDARVRYVIWNRKIYNPSISPSWRAYSGSNPHTRHVHLSVSLNRHSYDSTAPWGITTEELTVADVDKLLKRLVHLDAHLHQIRDDVGAIDRRVRTVESRVPGNLAAEVDEVRRNVRDIALAAGVGRADIEGDPHADDPPGGGGDGR